MLELPAPLAIESVARLAEECAVGRPLLSACYRGQGAPPSELESARVKVRCSAPHDCFSDALVLAPGASGCPLFDETTGELAALGVSSLKESSRTVCLTRALVEDLVNADFVRPDQ